MYKQETQNGRTKSKTALKRTYETKMKKIITSYNSGGSSSDMIRKVNEQVETLKLNLKDQIEKQTEHSQRLALMKEQTEEMKDEARQYRDNAREVHHAAWWLNKKWQFLIGGTVVLMSLLVIILVMKIL